MEEKAPLPITSTYTGVIPKTVQTGHPINPQTLGQQKKAYQTAATSYSGRFFSGQLLNDEIVSTYLRLLERRNARDCSLPNVLALDSYFSSVLRRSGYERARGHHRDQDLLAYEMILFPVHEELADVGHWWLLVVEPKKATISAYDFLKGRNHRTAMDLLHDYVKKEKMRARTEARYWRLYGARTCPSQDNLLDCGGFLCEIAGAKCGGRETKELQLHTGDRWQTTGGLDYRDREQLSDYLDSQPDRIGALQEEVDSVNPPEGSMEIDRGMSPKPTLLKLGRVSPMNDDDVLSLSPGRRRRHSFSKSLFEVRDPIWGSAVSRSFDVAAAASADD
ncbi:SUMO1 sentrin specific peptidase 1 [Homalodisca vitripennis]|nr:SUMO1 sentrin specific peptidase 1 [Homalodisca vitripennis]